ncbi:hypothetical protein HanIR_Chr04g0162781 [Helianthus annuus]|nr:hypothetical protein HanIR_Chr04g0162781 [Helianthus annuus]
MNNREIGSITYQKFIYFLAKSMLNRFGHQKKPLNSGGRTADTDFNGVGGPPGVEMAVAMFYNVQEEPQFKKTAMFYNVQEEPQWRWGWRVWRYMGG